METLGICIYNVTRNEWLQEDEKSWGPYEGRAEFTQGNEHVAEDIRLRETRDGDISFTVAFLH